MKLQTHFPRVDTQDYRTTVKADITDASRFGASGKGSALVTRGTFRIALDVDRWIVRPHESATLKIRAVDYEGHPRAHLPVAVQAGLAELARVETDGDGRATVTVPTTTRGDLTLK